MSTAALRIRSACSGSYSARTSNSTGNKREWGMLFMLNGWRVVSLRSCVSRSVAKRAFALAAVQRCQQQAHEFAPANCQDDCTTNEHGDCEREKQTAIVFHHQAEFREVAENRAAHEA